MDVIGRGRNVPIPSGLRGAAQRKLARVEHLAHDVARAEVDFSEERNPSIPERCRCAVVVHRRRERVAAQTAAPDPEIALDRALDKLRHHLDRRRDRR